MTQRVYCYSLAGASMLHPFRLSVSELTICHILVTRDPHDPWPMTYSQTMA